MAAASVPRWRRGEGGGAWPIRRRLPYPSPAPPRKHEEFGRNGEISSPVSSAECITLLCLIHLLSTSAGFTVSPPSASTLSRARQNSPPRLPSLCSDTFHLVQLFISFCSCLVFCCLLRTRNACGKFKRRPVGENSLLFTSCVCVRARARLCPTPCLMRAPLPGIVKLTASQMNADKTSTAGCRRESTAHIVPQFEFCFSFIWCEDTLCFLLALLQQRRNVFFVYVLVLRRDRETSTCRFWRSLAVLGRF